MRQEEIEKLDQLGDLAFDCLILFRQVMLDQADRVQFKRQFVALTKRGMELESEL